MLHAEFSDLMPHRIVVTTRQGSDDYGQEVYDPGSERTYECLISYAPKVMRGQEVEEFSGGATIYVNAYPLGVDGKPGSSSVFINTDDKLVVTPQVGNEEATRQINSIEKYFDETGNLHNMVVRTA